MQPTTRYAKSGNVHVAYQVFGDGPKNLVFVPGFISHIENYWDEPKFARWLDQTNDITRMFLAAGQIPDMINLAGGLPDAGSPLD